MDKLLRFMIISSPNDETPTTSARPSLLNLPLKIKDEIFSHLLLGAKVKKGYRGMPAHRYDWHTAILRVNRILNAEATEYLRTKNTFVAFGFNLPEIADMIDNKTAMIPFVNKRERTFSYPTIKLTVERGVDGAEMERRILLVEHIPQLVKCLRLVFHIVHAEHARIITEPGRPPVHFALLPSITINHTSIDISGEIYQQHGPRPLTLDELESKKAAFLQHFASFGRRGQCLHVQGVAKPLTEQLSENLVIARIVRIEVVGWDLVIARIVRIEVVGWDLVNLLKEQKAMLDQSLEEGVDDICFETIYVRYEVLANIASKGGLCGDGSGDREKWNILWRQNKRHAAWQTALAIIAINCHIVCLTISIKAHCSDRLDRNLEAIDYWHRKTKFWTDLPIPSDLRSLLYHMRALSDAADRESTDWATEVETRLGEAANLTPDSIDIFHDLRLMREGHQVVESSGLGFDRTNRVSTAPYAETVQHGYLTLHNTILQHLTLIGQSIPEEFDRPDDVPTDWAAGVEQIPQDVSAALIAAGSEWVERN